MEIIFQILFVVLAGMAIWLFTKKVKEIRRNIFLGRAEDLSGNSPQRWRNLLLLALGQKKMFKNPLVAVMHFVIYAGFIIINLEVLEIVLDGILGSHRLFTNLLPPGLYSFLINAFEFLAVGVFSVCVIFLIRRNTIKLKRFISKDLNGWPRSDANYILITEIILMALFLTMNATDTLLQQRGYGHYAEHLTGNFAFSSLLHPLLNGFGNESLLIIERV
ncbi:MAG TPA: Fe-S oxidoreductase, partial [Panacibacter sp.]|nr:Fe-S oxidoreductase [Panacibacter sp.]